MKTIVSIHLVPNQQYFQPPLLQNQKPGSWNRTKRREEMCVKGPSSSFYFYDSQMPDYCLVSLPRRQFHFMHDFILCMENSEWYLIPLDLNSVKIFLKYTLACYDHRAKFFPWVLRKCLVHIMKSLIHATWFIRMASNHILFLPHKYYNTEFYKVALWNIFAKEKWFLSCELKNKQQKITDKSQTLQHAAMSWINGLSSSSKRNS